MRIASPDGGARRPRGCLQASDVITVAYSAAVIGRAVRALKLSIFVQVVIDFLLVRVLVGVYGLWRQKL